MEKIKVTAYHEAGHAVAYLVKGIKFKDVSIVPNNKENSRGHITFSRNLAKRKDADSLLPKTFIKHGITTLAGICAEKIKFGEYCSVGFESDKEMAIDYFIRAEINDTNEYIEKTEKLLLKHWKGVEIIALKLLEKKTLTYQETIDLLKTSQS
jgi:ATP-dependent Zn protease